MKRANLIKILLVIGVVAFVVAPFAAQAGERQWPPAWGQKGITVFHKAADQTTMQSGPTESHLEATARLIKPHQMDQHRCAELKE